MNIIKIYKCKIILLVLIYRLQLVGCNPSYSASTDRNTTVVNPNVNNNNSTDFKAVAAVPGRRGKTQTYELDDSGDEAVSGGAKPATVEGSKPTAAPKRIDLSPRSNPFMSSPEFGRKSTRARPSMTGLQSEAEDGMGPKGINDPGIPTESEVDVKVSSGGRGRRGRGIAPGVDVSAPGPEVNISGTPAAQPNRNFDDVSMSGSEYEDENRKSSTSRKVDSSSVQMTQHFPQAPGGAPGGLGLQRTFSMLDFNAPAARPGPAPSMMNLGPGNLANQNSPSMMNLGPAGMGMSKSPSMLNIRPPGPPGMTRAPSMMNFGPNPPGGLQRTASMMSMGGPMGPPGLHKSPSMMSMAGPMGPPGPPGPPGMSRAPSMMNFGGTMGQQQQSYAESETEVFINKGGSRRKSSRHGSEFGAPVQSDTEVIISKNKSRSQSRKVSPSIFSGSSGEYEDIKFDSEDESKRSSRLPMDPGLNAPLGQRSKTGSVMNLSLADLSGNYEDIKLQSDDERDSLRRSSRGPGPGPGPGLQRTPSMLSMSGPGGRDNFKSRPRRSSSILNLNIPKPGSGDSGSDQFITTPKTRPFGPRGQNFDVASESGEFEDIRLQTDDEGQGSRSRGSRHPQPSNMNLSKPDDKANESGTEFNLNVSERSRRHRPGIPQPGQDISQPGSGVPQPGQGIKQPGQDMSHPSKEGVLSRDQGKDEDKFKDQGADMDNLKKSDQTRSQYVDPLRLIVDISKKWSTKEIEYSHDSSKGIDVFTAIDPHLIFKVTNFNNVLWQAKNDMCCKKLDIQLRGTEDPLVQIYFPEVQIKDMKKEVEKRKDRSQNLDNLDVKEETLSDYGDYLNFLVTEANLSNKPEDQSFVVKEVRLNAESDSDIKLKDKTKEVVDSDESDIYVEEVRRPKKDKASVLHLASVDVKIKENTSQISYKRKGDLDIFTAVPPYLIDKIVKKDELIWEAPNFNYAVRVEQRRINGKRNFKIIFPSDLAECSDSGSDLEKKARRMHRRPSPTLPPHMQTSYAPHMQAPSQHASPNMYQHHTAPFGMSQPQFAFPPTTPMYQPHMSHPQAHAPFMPTHVPQPSAPSPTYSYPHKPYDHFMSQSHMHPSMHKSYTNLNFSQSQPGPLYGPPSYPPSYPHQLYTDFIIPHSVPHSRSSKHKHRSSRRHDHSPEVIEMFHVEESESGEEIDSRSIDPSNLITIDINVKESSKSVLYEKNIHDNVEIFTSIDPYLIDEIKKDDKILWKSKEGRYSKKLLLWPRSQEKPVLRVFIPRLKPYVPRSASSKHGSKHFALNVDLDISNQFSTNEFDFKCYDDGNPAGVTHHQYDTKNGYRFNSVRRDHTPIWKAKGHSQCSPKVAVIRDKKYGHEQVIIYMPDGSRNNYTKPNGSAVYFRNWAETESIPRYDPVTGIMTVSTSLDINNKSHSTYYWYSMYGNVSTFTALYGFVFTTITQGPMIIWTARDLNDVAVKVDLVNDIQLIVYTSTSSKQFLRNDVGQWVQYGF